MLEALDVLGRRGPVPEDAGTDRLLGPTPVMNAASAMSVRRVNAAVLVALFEEAGEARLILTRRASDLRTHRGEVSFPGGRLDQGEDPVAAARREAYEEIALDPTVVTTVGWIDPVMTMVSASVIMPILATLAERPDLQPNPQEVERLFDVSLAELADPEIFHEERWRVAGHTIPGSDDDSFAVWFFEVSGEMIWGATARIIHELLSIVLTERRGG